MVMRFSDDESDWLLEMFNSDGVRNQLAKNLPRIVEEDVAGNAIKVVKGRQKGDGSFKLVAAELTAMYKVKFSLRLLGEERASFKTRKKARSLVGLTTHRKVAESDEHYEQRLNFEVLRTSERIYNWLTAHSMNKVSRQKSVKLTNATAALQQHTAYSVYRLSHTPAATGLATTSSQPDGATSSTQSHDATSSTPPDTVTTSTQPDGAAWNRQLKADFLTLTSDQVQALEREAHELNTLWNKPLEPDMVRAMQAEKQKQLDANVSKQLHSWSTQTGFRGHFIMGGPTNDGSIRHFTVHNAVDCFSQTFPQYMCKRLGIQLQRWAIEEDLYFQNVFDMPPATVDTLDNRARSSSPTPTAVQADDVEDAETIAGDEPMGKASDEGTDAEDVESVADVLDHTELQFRLAEVLADAHDERAHMAHPSRNVQMVSTTDEIRSASTKEYINIDVIQASKVQTKTLSDNGAPGEAGSSIGRENLEFSRQTSPAEPAMGPANFAMNLGLASEPHSEAEQGRCPGTDFFNLPAIGGAGMHTTESHGTLHRRNASGEPSGMVPLAPPSSLPQTPAPVPDELPQTESPVRKRRRGMVTATQVKKHRTVDADHDKASDVAHVQPRPTTKRKQAARGPAAQSDAIATVTRSGRRVKEKIIGTTEYDRVAAGPQHSRYALSLLTIVVQFASLSALYQTMITPSAIPYAQCKNWSGNPNECPNDRYSVNFDVNLKALVQEEAEKQHIDLTDNMCLQCGKPGTIAIGKKIGRVGEIYLNCSDCKKVYQFKQVVMSEDSLCIIETMRAEEVQEWKAWEGPAAYLQACAAGTPGTPGTAVNTPAPPSSQIVKAGFGSARNKSLQGASTSATAASFGTLRGLMSPIDDDRLIRAVIKREATLVDWPSDTSTLGDPPVTPESRPLKTRPPRREVQLKRSADSEESELEVLGPYVSKIRQKKKQVNTHTGTKDAPITLPSSALLLLPRRPLPC
ncbi:hypothetical protein BC835DRAFT_1416574 [Cytidiella melzeri]|nr:hypothetical protein BC835DRAFT_1416574 [Cytidiella melzeri]